MKKLKTVLISLSLVFCFLFLTACGGDPPPNQLDVKPNINTTGNYIESTEDEFNSVINCETYANGVNGVRYYVQGEANGQGIELNMIMKFNYDETSSTPIIPTQLAARMKMNYNEPQIGKGTIESSTYVKNFSENRIYTEGKMNGVVLTQEYYNTNLDLDSFIGSSGTENAPDLGVDPSNFSETIKSLIGDAEVDLLYTKTEKDANGIVKYKLSATPSLTPDGDNLESESNLNDDTTTMNYSKIDVCLIIKEVGENVYFQGISIETTGTVNDGLQIITAKSKVIMTLFSGNIEFPDFSNYTLGKNNIM